VKKTESSGAILDMSYMAQPVHVQMKFSIETVHSQTCGKYAVHLGISYTEDGEFGSALKLSMTRKDRARISTQNKKPKKTQTRMFERDSSRYFKVCARKMINPDDAVIIEAVLHMIPSVLV
jgi:hypothetical protein